MTRPNRLAMLAYAEEELKAAREDSSHYTTAELDARAEEDTAWLERQAEAEYARRMEED